MEHWLDRTRLLLGEEKMDRLKAARVVVLGLGGVGSAAAEALCRGGVGSLMLVDRDAVGLTNLNRQLVATTKTIGEPKALALAKRLLDINPEINLVCSQEFVLPDNCEFIWGFCPSYIIDAIDTVTAKLYMAETAMQKGVPIVASMGTGGRLDPTQLRIGDIADTAGTGCALGRVIRRELKKRGVAKLDVVYSLEMPSKLTVGEENGRHPPASSAFVPPAAGFALASHVIRNL